MSKGKGQTPEKKNDDSGSDSGVKSAFLSKTNWLGLTVIGLAVLEYMEQIPELPQWGLAVVGCLIVALRAMTSTSVSWKPPKRDSNGRFTSASIVLLVGFIVIITQGCGAATCSTIQVERHPHPEKEAPAKRIVLKCGGETVEWHIEKTPECMGGCFK